MRIYGSLIILFALLFSACLFETKKQSGHLSKKKVFVVPFPELRPLEQAVIPADTSYLDLLFRMNGLVDIQELDSSFVVRLQYADTGNFLGLNFYDGLRKAYLHCDAALKLCNAQYFLHLINPDYSLLILDASRPLHIQQMMWDSLRMPVKTKYQYLSPPSEPSLHNYGCAVDLTILDQKNARVLDMGTEPDDFDPLSEPASESRFLKSGELSREAYANRLLLRKVMTMAKFKPIPTEWWHFSICTKPEAQKKFKLIP
ncbi:MAG TPA: M15 family metallopeptidase [Bacteroidia bacterium]|nr:M15 family metallopeptidase [Bacteroidia bacterium]